MAHAKYSRARSALLASISPEKVRLIADIRCRIAQIYALNANIDALPDTLVRMAIRRYGFIRRAEEPFFIVGQIHYGEPDVGLDRQGGLWSLRPDKAVTPIILEEMPSSTLLRLQANLISLFLKIRHYPS